MIATANDLGIGLYTPQEAALYARVRTQTMNRWLFGNKQGKPVIDAQIRPDDEKTVTFIDLVQSLAVRSIRTQYRDLVSIQKIRAAAETAKNEYGVEFPFARDHRTFVIREGRHAGEIVIELSRGLVQITGKQKRQQLFGPIAELYLDQIEFGDDGYAAEYRPWQSQRAGAILLNPHRRFGEPLVEQCGYSARSLWEATIAEGGVDAAADAYGVSPEHVKLACSYFDHLLSDAA